MVPRLRPCLRATITSVACQRWQGHSLEWLACGGEHADAIISNAKALGQALQERGIRLLGQELGFTESHTLIPIVDEFGESKAMADQLEACNIIAGGASVPPELGDARLTDWGSRGDPTRYDGGGCAGGCGLYR